MVVMKRESSGKIAWVPESTERKREVYMKRTMSIVRSLVDVIILANVAQSSTKNNVMMSEESFWEREKEIRNSMGPMLSEKMNKDKRLEKLSLEEYWEMKHYIEHKRKRILMGVSFVGNDVDEAAGGGSSAVQSQPSMVVANCGGGGGGDEA